MIITIDGLGGTGKTSQAKTLAKKIGFKCFDTGAIYRAITLKLINEGIDPRNTEKLYEMLESSKIIFDNEKVFLDGIDVSERIRKMDITVNSAYIATIKDIKKKVIDIQKSFGNKYDTVMEGRDIGTRIFPNANVKFYLTATPEVRAKRRFLEGKDNLTYEEILEKMKERDRIEITAKSIIIPDDAVIIDTSNRSFEEVNSIMLKVTRQRIKCGERDLDMR